MKIKATFAYYDFGSEDGKIRPSACYLIDESDIRELPVGGNVSAGSLHTFGIKIPATPTYREWVESGSPIYRGNLARRRLTAAVIMPGIGKPE